MLKPHLGIIVEVGDAPLIVGRVHDAGAVRQAIAHSLAWLILSAAAYRDWRSDVLPALAAARDRLAALVQEPQRIQDTSTIALAALALDPETANNPLEVRSCAP